MTKTTSTKKNTSAYLGEEISELKLLKLIRDIKKVKKKEINVNGKGPEI